MAPERAINRVNLVGREKVTIKLLYSSVYIALLVSLGACSVVHACSAMLRLVVERVLAW